MTKTIEKSQEKSEKTLPKGWKWTTLDDVCRDISDGTHFTPTYTTKGVPFLSVKDVKETGISFESCRYISEEQHQQLIRRCKPEKGDVLYTKVGTTGIAKAIDIDREFSIFVSVALLKLKDEVLVLPEYLERVLNSPICRTQAAQLTQGAANRNLVLKDLKRISFPLAPLVEQKRIVALLNEQMTAIEKARAATLAQVEAAKALPAAYLREVFESPEAQKWKWIRLEEHTTKIGSGITPRGGHTTYLKSGIPLVRSQNVHMNRFEPLGLAYISPEQDDLMKQTRVIPGDVLLNITGASIGRVCVVPVDLCPANVNQHVSIIRSDGSFEPAFLAYYISTPDFQKFILDSEAGATRQALTKSLIEAFKIPLPSLSEQKRIVTTLNSQMEAVKKTCIAVESQLEAINQLPAALLRQAFSGEL